MAVGFDGHEEEPVFKLSPVVGNFYLTRPEGDPDTWGEYQFWVVEVKALGVMPDGLPGVRVQYWELKKAKKSAPLPKPADQVYEPRCAKTPVDKLDMIYVASLEDHCPMKTGSLST